MNRRHSAALGFLVWLVTAFVGVFWLARGDDTRVVETMLFLSLPYAAAVRWVLRRGPQPANGRMFAVVIGAAVVVRVALLPWPPYSSDIYRYVWDGRVQAQGINPYRYMPADPALKHLRDQAIYHNINRPDVAVTIYPPAAQMLFLAVTRLSESAVAMKIAMVLLEGLGVFALLRLMDRRGIPRTRLLLYLWHPLPLFEFAGSGHIDAAAIAFMLVALWVADQGRPWLAGVSMALGAGMKFFPAFIAPALYRRWDWRLPAAFAATLALLYLPYLSVGKGVLGYMGGYVQEENFSGSNGVFWLAALEKILTVPKWLPTAYLAVAGAVLLASGLAVVFRRRPGMVSPGAAMALLGAFTVVVTPHYPWYLTWTVPFLVFRPSAAIIWLTCAAPLLQGLVWPPDPFVKQALMYGPFLLLLVAEMLLRRGSLFMKDITDDSRLDSRATA